MILLGTEHLTSRSELLYVGLSNIYNYVPSSNLHIQHFFTEDIDTFFVLEEPIIAQRIKFSIHGDILDPGNRTCWEVSLFGCTAKDRGIIYGKNIHALSDGII